MSNISSIISSVYGNSAVTKTNANSSKKETNSKETGSKETSSSSHNINSAEGNSKTEKLYTDGKTIGKPTLSKKASEYYETLKKKYGNMDFILVSSDQKEQAKAQAGSYANANKMVVLIDEDKIEKMAEDENFREQYESIIANAASGIADLGSQISSTGAEVKGYGMQVNDNGTATYFAVLEKSSEAQKERIEKKAAEKKEAKKAEEKKAKKEEQQERLEKTKENNGKNNKIEKTDNDTITISASSIEELIKKLEDYTFAMKSDSIQTDEEKMVGQSIDFSV